MIIRNPYGFIVKHYKLINLLLLLPMVYLALKFGDISSFFRDYVSSNYSTPETAITNTYITILSMIAIIFMLISNIILYLILATKKKNSYYHLASIVYYFVCLICLMLFSATMETIETGKIDMTFIHFVRDTSNIVLMPIYILIVCGTAKGIGFNIKTFRLDANDDLKLNEEDEEDIEIKVGSDNNTIKRTSVHLIRELKYYILENKFVFSCIGVVLLLILCYNWYTEFEVNNKMYMINQSFSLDNFTLSIKESYLTKVDYHGNLIANDKYYLAVKIGLNNQGAATTIDKSSFRIYVGKTAIFPSYDRASRFIDIGKIYQGETINSGESNDYVFVYELTSNQLKSSYEMRILSGMTQKNSELINQYKKINIKPVNILKTETLGTLSKKKEVDLSSTTLGDTKFTLKDLQVVTSYTYEYESCDTRKNCTKVKDVVVPSGGKVLIIIDDELKLDETSSYYNNSEKDFYGDFISLKYVYEITTGGAVGDYTNTTTLKNITPKNLTNKRVYEVPSTLLEAKKIDMIITVRNKKVIINVK